LALARSSVLVLHRVVGQQVHPLGGLPVYILAGAEHAVEGRFLVLPGKRGEILAHDLRQRPELDLGEIAGDNA
jgi:hypothetical protein